MDIMPFKSGPAILDLIISIDLVGIDRDGFVRGMATRNEWDPIDISDPSVVIYYLVDAWQLTPGWFSRHRCGLLVDIDLKGHLELLDIEGSAIFTAPSYYQVRQSLTRWTYDDAEKIGKWLDEHDLLTTLP